MSSLCHAVVISHSGPECQSDQCWQDKNLLQASCISVILCVYGCLSLSQCEKASSCLHLGVITTRQQHVNKETECGVCALFSMLISQLMLGSVLCSAETNRAASLSASSSTLTSFLKSILLYYCFPSPLFMQERLC